jgi:hypothetical protein
LQRLGLGNSNLQNLNLKNSCRHLSDDTLLAILQKHDTFFFFFFAS